MLRNLTVLAMKKNAMAQRYRRLRLQPVQNARRRLCTIERDKSTRKHVKVQQQQMATKRLLGVPIVANFFCRQKSCLTTRKQIYTTDQVVAQVQPLAPLTHRRRQSKW